MKLRDAKYNSVISHKYLTNIYGLIDPITEETKYIGKADDLARRLKEHIVETNDFYVRNKCNKGRNTKKLAWINSLLQQNLRPIIELIVIVPKHSWQQYETMTIKRFKSFGAKLLNLTDGGDGYEMTSEQAITWVLRGDKHPNFNGKTVTSYQREIARKTIKENLLTPDGLKKLSELGSKRTGEKNPFYGKQVTEENKRITSEATKKFWAENEDRRIAQSNLMKTKVGENSPLYGCRYQWITDEIENKRNPLDEQIPIGWRKGRKKIVNKLTT